MSVNVVTQLQVKSHNSPDETRSPDKTTVEVVTVGDYTIGRTTFEPGWTWDDCIKPVVGTDSCQLSHVGFCVSGSIEVETNDGAQISISSGDSYCLTFAEPEVALVAVERLYAVWPGLEQRDGFHCPLNIAVHKGTLYAFRAFYSGSTSTSPRVSRAPLIRWWRAGESS